MAKRLTAEEHKARGEAAASKALRNSELAACGDELRMLASKVRTMPVADLWDALDAVKTRHATAMGKA